MLRRRKRTIVVVFLLVTGAATLTVLGARPSFHAESRLMVRIGREFVYRPEVGGAPTSRAPTLSEIVNSEVEILSSRDLAEQVVRAIGVPDLYPRHLETTSDPERAIDLAVMSFREAVSIRPVLESSVIKVGFEHASPETAARAVNLLVDRFGDKHLEVFGEQRSDALQVQMAQREARLAEAEEHLEAFKSGHSVFDLEEQRRLLLGHRMALEESLHASELELAGLPHLPVPNGHSPELVELPLHLAPEMFDALLRQLFALKSELRSLGQELANPLVREASLRLLELELEEMVLLRDYSSSNRKVQCVRSEIELVREFLADAERQPAARDDAGRAERETNVAELQREIAAVGGDVELLVSEARQRSLLELGERHLALDTRCEELRQRRAGVDAELRGLDLHEKTLRRLERERLAATAALEASRSRVEEARLGEGLDREKQISVRVIEKAVPPAIPAGPPREIKLALAVAAGLLAGVAAAVLRELLRAR